MDTSKNTGNQPAKPSPMVFAFQLKGDGGVDVLDDASIAGTPGNPVWIHGDFQAEGCYEWLETLNIPDNVVETLMRQESRPRSFPTGSGMLLILRVLNLNPGEDPEDMVSLRMWIEKNRIITVRQRRVFSVQDLREEMLEGNGPSSLPELLVSLVERIADRISVYVDDLEEVIDGYEEKIEVLDPTLARTQISRIRRQAATVRRYLAPQREALDKFNLLGKEVMDEFNQYLMQDLSDRIVRYVEDLDLVREQTQVLLDELINRVSQEQNSRMYVLSIIAAIFLPISFVTGLFGMNVGGLPGLENPLGFIAVCVLMGAISVGIIAYFRSRRWL